MFRGLYGLRQRFKLSGLRAGIQNKTGSSTGPMQGKHMKFNRITRTAKAVGISLAIGLGLVACSRDYTCAYVYSISDATGSISAFAVDYQSGILTQLSGSPFTGQATNPVTLVAHPNGKTIYVVGGSQNAIVTPYSIGSDGKLYGGTTVNITGSYATGATIDPAGTHLYVTYTYEIPPYSGGPTYGPVLPGPGGITVFPINSDGSLGTASNVNVGNNPVAIAVSVPTCTTTPALPSSTAGSVSCTLAGGGSGYENVFAYVVDQEGSTYSPGAQPTLVGFVQNPTSGALTVLPGTPYNAALKTYQGQNAGVKPSAVAIDPTGRYVYIVDEAANNGYGYQIAYTTTGATTPLVSNPFTTGLYPVAITIEPRGKYVYVANYNSNTVSSYSLTAATGALGGTAAVGNFSVSTGPTCVTVEPSLGEYLFTSNRLDNSLSGGKLNPDTGQLNAVPNTPFPTISEPNCIVSVPNGSHASQIDNQ
jgi:6-phosphogluconolactonase (cycloisomerase 2 family)